MPLPLPKLDSRTYDELTREGVALIPRRAPDWTDHNASDPGITLLELFAWLAEMLLYRADRVTPAMLRATLRLVGVEPRRAAVARTVVAIRRAPQATGPLILPAGAALATVAGTTDFATTTALSVSRAWLELTAEESTDRGRVVVGHSGGRHDATTANRSRERTFAPFGPAPVRGDSLQLGFDVLPAGPGELLALHCWSAAWAEEESMPPTPAPHHAACTVWEYSTGAGTWRALGGVLDETRALSRSGSVLLPGPSDHTVGADGRWWIRCRLVAGGYECPPALTAVAVNGVGASHAVAVRGPELVAISRGQAGQQYRLDQRPVVPGSTRVRIASPGVPDELWTEVADWDRSRPDEPHYRLEPAEGLLTFGDGRRGRVPPAGCQIVADGYLRGGGAAGNARSDVLAAVSPPLPEALTVAQPFPTAGGAAAESLAHAHGRALRRLSGATRAVTVEDIETLARATPGLRVGRARALPGVHPELPCVPAAGLVSVVVLPACGSPPRPTPGFLATVARHLEAVRPLGTELRVVAPQYVDAGLSVTLHAGAAAPADIAERAAARLSELCDPLHGGPNGTGWPFGRDLLSSELLAVLATLPGVVFAEDLAFAVGAAAEPRCGSVVLCPTELVNLRSPRIDVVWG